MKLGRINFGPAASRPVVLPLIGKPSASEEAMAYELSLVTAQRDELRATLERVLVEEINGRLCPLPETDEEWAKLEKRCPSCAETWRQVRAATTGPKALPPHDHTIEPGEINRRGCRRCAIEQESASQLRRSRLNALALAGATK